MTGECDYPYAPAAFINVIAEGGTKKEAIEWLQITWNELCWVREQAKRQGQSKSMSLTEAMINTILGFGIAMAAQLVIFPLFDIHVPMHDHLMIGALFTVVSIARSYCLRRLFNKLHEKGITL